MILCTYSRVVISYIQYNLQHLLTWRVFVLSLPFSVLRADRAYLFPNPVRLAFMFQNFTPLPTAVRSHTQLSNTLQFVSSPFPLPSEHIPTLLACIATCIHTIYNMSQRHRLSSEQYHNFHLLRNKAERVLPSQLRTMGLT